MVVVDVVDGVVDVVEVEVVVPVDAFYEVAEELSVDAVVVVVGKVYVTDVLDALNSYATSSIVII